MTEYHKIQSIFKRSQENHKFIIGEWSRPEFEYLKDNTWVFTEKIDGTNVRVFWDTETVKFGGRTGNSQMPIFLMDKLNELFPVEKFKNQYSAPMCLYGEGFGARIQKGGGNYISDGVSFILFDVKIDNWWLKRYDVHGIASCLGIDIVPVVGEGTINDAISIINQQLKSCWGDFLAEGLVIRPKAELMDRGGHRIISKLKHKDFE